MARNTNRHRMTPRPLGATAMTCNICAETKPIQSFESSDYRLYVYRECAECRKIQRYRKVSESNRQKALRNRVELGSDEQLKHRRPGKPPWVELPHHPYDWMTPLNHVRRLPVKPELA